MVSESDEEQIIGIARSLSPLNAEYGYAPLPNMVLKTVPERTSIGVNDNMVVRYPDLTQEDVDCFARLTSIGDCAITE